MARLKKKKIFSSGFPEKSLFFFECKLCYPIWAVTPYSRFSNFNFKYFK